MIQLPSIKFHLEFLSRSTANGLGLSFPQALISPHTSKVTPESAGFNLIITALTCVVCFNHYSYMAWHLSTTHLMKHMESLIKEAALHRANVTVLIFRENQLQPDAGASAFKKYWTWLLEIRSNEFLRSEKCSAIPHCAWWSLIDSQRQSENSMLIVRRFLSNFKEQV